MSKHHPQSESMKALEQSLNDHMEICSLNRKVKRLKSQNARLKAEVERLRKAGEWQPIETAPRDGTWFIAGFDGDLPSRHAWAAMCIWECGRFEVQETPDQPDYWMPLPKPQKEGKSQP